jgi:hypothetical protein
MKQIERKTPSLEEQIISILHSFWASYLKWLYLQNPYFSTVFTTEEIVNFSEHVKKPWVIRTIAAKNVLKYYALFYAFVAEYAQKAELFGNSMMISLDFPGSFSSEEKNSFHRPTEKMLSYLKALSGGIIPDEEIQNMDFQTCSVTISILKKGVKSHA